MGCRASSADYSIESMPLSTKRNLYTIKLDDDDIESFFVLYINIKKRADVKTESIAIQSVLNYFSLETVSFMCKCLSFFNIGLVQNFNIIEDFRAFTFSVWNFLTLTDELLLDFAFSLYGDTLNNVIKAAAMSQMVREIYGIRSDSVVALRLFAKIEEALTKITLDRKGFGDFSVMNLPLMAPIQATQLKWRRKLFGLKKWDKFCSDRSTISEKFFVASSELKGSPNNANGSGTSVSGGTVIGSGSSTLSSGASTPSKKVNSWMTNVSISPSKTRSQSLIGNLPFDSISSVERLGVSDAVMEFTEVLDEELPIRTVKSGTAVAELSATSKGASAFIGSSTSPNSKKSENMEYQKVNLSKKTSWASEEMSVIKSLQPRQNHYPIKDNSTIKS